MWWRDREGVESAVIAEIVDLRGKRVLDLGCGTGRLTEFVALQAEKVFERAMPPLTIRESVRLRALGAL